jgi:hypothetical protein
VRNAVGLAARRASLTLTQEQLAEADRFVLAGQTPQKAVDLAGQGFAAPPVPARPVAPPATLPAGTPAPTSPQGWSAQQVRNEVGIAARRAKLTLTPKQLEEADALVKAGQSPIGAVTAVAPPPPPPPAKLQVTAAEMGTYGELRRLGKTHAEAVDLIRVQRELATQLGTPPSETVRQAIAERNATGRWRDE